MIKIAGREVQIGNSLYHSSLRMWGSVARYDASGAAVLEIAQSSGASRKLLITDGGTVAGRKEIFWHEPLFLDSPLSDVSDIQEIVNIVARKIGSNHD